MRWGLRARPLGTLVAGVLLVLGLAYLSGLWWRDQEVNSAVAEAINGLHGTGSTAPLDRVFRAGMVAIACGVFAVAAGILVGAAVARRRAAVVIVLVVLATLACFTGFTAAAGTGGRDLADDIPSRLLDVVTPAASPLVEGPLYIVAAVTLGSLVGFGVGHSLRAWRGGPSSRSSP